MRTHAAIARLAVFALATLVAASCGNAPAPTPAAPTADTIQPLDLPSVWDNPAVSGILPGGVDGESVFGAGLTAVEPARIEGVVRGVRGTCPNIGIRIGDRIVRTFERTVFDGQRCAAIAVRDRIIVVGRPIGDDGLFGAMRVQSRKP